MRVDNLKLIWVNGMPRSGTSWLAQIIDSSPNVNFKMAPLFSYEFKNVVNEDSTDEDWFDFLMSVYFSEDPFLNQIDRKKSGDFISFTKEVEPEYLCIKDVRNHQLIERIVNLGERVKVIHIVRNPCATISSWIHSKKEFVIKDQTKSDEWKTGATRKTNQSEFWGFNDWIELTTKYQNLQKKFPKQIYVVRYEDLLHNPVLETKKIFQFCGLEFNEQTNSFLTQSHSKHEESDYSVFKSPEKTLNSWKSLLNQDVKDEIIQTTIEKGLSKYLEE